MSKTDLSEEKGLIRKLLLPDGSSHSLSVAMASRSGSGKTTLLTRLITEARKDEAFKDVRFIYVSVKEEHLFKEKKLKPTNDLYKLFKHLRKNSIGIFYPSDPANYELEVDALIENVFQLSNSNPNTGFVIILDDANILKGFDNRGTPSPAVKKLAVAGRSKNIRGLYITHRIANLPRIMMGNLSGLILMSISSMDLDYSRKIFGVDFEPILPELHSYRWAYVDLISEKMDLFNPVKVV